MNDARGNKECTYPFLIKICNAELDTVFNHNFDYDTGHVVELVCVAALPEQQLAMARGRLFVKEYQDYFHKTRIWPDEWVYRNVY